MLSKLLPPEFTVERVAIEDRHDMRDHRAALRRFQAAMRM